MKRFWNKILNLLYCEKIKCIICSDELDEDGDYLMCENCLKELPYNKTFCQVCGTPISDMGVVCNHSKENKFDFNFIYIE